MVYRNFKEISEIDKYHKIIKYQEVMYVEVNVINRIMKVFVIN